MIARIFRLAAFGAAAFEYQDVIGEQGQSIDFVPMIKRGMKGVDPGSGLERRRCERRTCRCRFGRFVRIDSRDGARSAKRPDAPAPNLTHPCSPDLPPSQWSNIDDILDYEGDKECRARSIARMGLSTNRREEHTSEVQSLMRTSYAVL